MTSRRNFIKKSAIAAAGLYIFPSNVISGLGHKAPSDKLNIVGIGVGGKGHPNLVGMKTGLILKTASMTSRKPSVTKICAKCLMK